MLPLKASSQIQASFDGLCNSKNQMSFWGTYINFICVIKKFSCFNLSCLTNWFSAEFSPVYYNVSWWIRQEAKDTGKKGEYSAIRKHYDKSFSNFVDQTS
jgi:hypothetical protein